MKKKFTGGDKLEGFEKYLHHVLMLNELGGGVGGYELADAKIGKSGYSFGGNQMDLDYHQNYSHFYQFWHLLTHSHPHHRPIH